MYQNNAAYAAMVEHMDDRVELYDLEADIGEQYELSDERPKLANRLLGMLKRWQTAVGARFDYLP